MLQVVRETGEGRPPSVLSTLSTTSFSLSLLPLRRWRRRVSKIVSGVVTSSISDRFVFTTYNNKQTSIKSVERVQIKKITNNFVNPRTGSTSSIFNLMTVAVVFLLMLLPPVVPDKISIGWFIHSSDYFSFVILNYSIGIHYNELMLCVSIELKDN